jgi:Protein of unknown function (DUF1631)
MTLLKAIVTQFEFRDCYMSAKIHKFDSVQNKKYESLISDIKDCLNNHLEDLLTNMFNGADDALFHMAEIAESNEDQNHYFDTMRMLRLERKIVEDTFFTSLKSHLIPISQSQDNTQQESSCDDELTLVDQETMEEMVAISSMHTKAMNLFGDAINHLEARLEVLAMKTTLIFEKDALQPKCICEAFQAALKSVELDTKNKLILYKLFDQEVSSKMEDCYLSVNKRLVEEGILPQIKSGISIPKNKTIQNSPSTQLRNSETVDNYDISDDLIDENTFSINNNYSSIRAPDNTSNSSLTNYGKSFGTTTQAQDEINRVIHQFMHNGISSPPNSNSPLSSNSTEGSASQYYDRRDVLSALSNLQQDFYSKNNENTTIDIENFKKALVVQMSKKNGGIVTKQVNQLDEKTIDFIEMLFEVIVEDISISEVITNLLLRLQIPVIKAAMLDEEIFKNNSHPARHLLNLIVEVGKGIADKHDELYQPLENEVDTLLNDFDSDMVSFQIAIENIKNIIIQASLITEDNEKSTQKIALQEHARMIVLTELQHHLKGKYISKSVHPLILKHWPTLMFHRYIRNGKESTAWKEASNILLLLVNSLQPLKTKASWLSLKHNHTDLIATINGYLQGTKINGADIESSLSSLKITYDLMIEKSDFNFSEDENHPPEELNELFDPDERIEEEITIESFPCDSKSLEAAINNIDETDNEFNAINHETSEAELARQKITALPREVRPGVWFEIFINKDSAIRRLKLSVIIMDEAKLIFVDRLGKKVIDKDAEEFNNELSSEKSKIIADHSAFDFALEKVISSLSASA